MFRIVPKTTIVGEYEVTVYERFFKSFKKPILISWISPEEPLVRVTRKGENVLIEKCNMDLLEKNEINFVEVFKKCYHVNQVMKICNEIGEFKKSYAFDNNQNCVNNTKKNFNLMLDQPYLVFESKLKAIEYSSKKFSAIDYDSFIKRDDVSIINHTYENAYLKKKEESILIHSYGFNKTKHEESLNVLKENKECRFNKYACTDIIDEKGFRRHVEMYLDITFNEIIKYIKSGKDFNLDVESLVEREKEIDQKTFTRAVFKDDINPLYDVKENKSIIFDIMLEKGIIFLKKCVDNEKDVLYT